MDMEVEVSVSSSKIGILSEFRDFAKKVMCLDMNVCKHKERARVYRVGVTNAADRGLDMYSNWELAIQIKHLSLDIELAKEIVASIDSDSMQGCGKRCYTFITYTNRLEKPHTKFCCRKQFSNVV